MKHVDQFGDSGKGVRDALQLVLKKNGKPVAGVHVDKDNTEIRSPTLQRDERTGSDDAVGR